MGTTSNYQIPYPELTDRPDGATQMKDLASRVDVKLKPVDDRVVAIEKWNASGYITNPTVVWQSGWAIDTTSGYLSTQRFGPLVFFAVRFKRTGAAIPVTAGTGNISDSNVIQFTDSRLGNLPDSTLFLPILINPLAGAGGGTGYISGTPPTFVFSAFYPGATTIATGDAFFAAGTYPVIPPP